MTAIKHNLITFIGEGAVDEQAARRILMSEEGQEIESLEVQPNYLYVSTKLSIDDVAQKLVQALGYDLAQVLVDIPDFSVAYAFNASPSSFTLTKKVHDEDSLNDYRQLLKDEGVRDYDYKCAHCNTLLEDYEVEDGTCPVCEEE